jgi:hypothetical protein
VQNGPQSIRKSWARQTWPTGVVRIRQKLSLLAPSTPGSRKEIGSKTAAVCTKLQKNYFFNMDPGKQVSLISYSFFNSSATTSLPNLGRQEGKDFGRTTIFQLKNVQRFSEVLHILNFAIDKNRLHVVQRVERSPM